MSNYQTTSDLRRRIESDGEEAPVAMMPKHRFVKPRVMLGGTFLGLILLGTLCLLSPLCQASGQWAWMGGSGLLQSLVDTWFAATSSVCVTGLTVQDITTQFSFTGQVVLLGLVQIGGIGIMTLGSFFLVITGFRLSAQDESAMMLSYGMSRVADVRSIVRKTVEFVIAFESIGAMVLFCRYHFAYSYEPVKAAWYAIFHSVSAFCNAGISLHPDNLIAMQDDPIYLLTISLLVIFGGLGFLVLGNLSTYKFWKRDLHQRGRLTLHTLIVLRFTFWLLLFGTILFAMIEWRGALNVEDNGIRLWTAFTAQNWTEFRIEFVECLHKIMLSFFQAVSPRTAGFNAIPMAELSQAGSFLTSLLMLIGGSPGSMAGGIKTTTIIVLFLTVRSMLRSRQEVEVSARTLPFTVVREAIVIVLLYLMMVFLTYFVLLWTEDAILAKGGMGLLFEVISAYGTVGLSLDNTQDLSLIGRCVISFAMFVGRLGPVTLALMIGSRAISQRVRYPEERITVG